MKLCCILSPLFIKSTQSWAFVYKDILLLTELFDSVVLERIYFNKAFEISLHHFVYLCFQFCLFYK